MDWQYQILTATGAAVLALGLTFIWDYTVKEGYKLENKNAHATVGYEYTSYVYLPEMTTPPTRTFYPVTAALVALCALQYFSNSVRVALLVAVCGVVVSTAAWVLYRKWYDG